MKSFWDIFFHHLLLADIRYWMFFVRQPSSFRALIEICDWAETTFAVFPFHDNLSFANTFFWYKFRKRPENKFHDVDVSCKWQKKLKQLVSLEGKNRFLKNWIFTNNKSWINHAIMTAYVKRTNKSPRRRKKSGKAEDEKNHIFLQHDI